MNSENPLQAIRSISIHPTVCSILKVLPICLLLLAFTGEVSAASGNTRLTLRIDQSVVDAVARWKGEMIQPSVAPAIPEADRVLQRLLPVAQAGLEPTHQPQTARLILQRLQRDALIVFDGRAGHAGSAGGICISDKAAGGFLIVHSI